MKTTKNLRLTAIILFCVMLLGAFVGCAQKPADSASTTPKVTTEPSSELEPEIKENKTYYENGQLRTHNVYYETGTIKYSVSYYENGSILSEAAWREDLSCEKKIEYYENGNIKSCLLFKTDSIEDKRIDFYENGNIKENYIYDEQNPISMKYNENGRLQSKTVFSLDVGAGYKYTEKEVIVYGDDGKVLSWSTYYDDTGYEKEDIYYYPGTEKIESRTTYYNRQGESKVKEYFQYNENGDLIYYRHYDENGNLIDSLEQPE